VTENNTADFASDKPGGVSRRTVTKAMAWAVPAIAIAAPVPAFAGASQGILTLDGTGCKLPGNSNPTYKGYAFNINVRNTTANTYFLVQIVSVFFAPNTNLGSANVINMDNCTLLGNPFCVAPGQNLTNLALLTSDANNSSNGQLIVTYRVAPTLMPANNTCNTLTPVYGPNQVAQTMVNDLDPINGASCTAFNAAQKECLESDFVGP
jgi:hypothetical protein